MQVTFNSATTSRFKIEIFIINNLVWIIKLIIYSFININQYAIRVKFVKQKPNNIVFKYKCTKINYCLNWLTSYIMCYNQRLKIHSSIS